MREYRQSAAAAASRAAHWLGREAAWAARDGAAHVPLVAGALAVALWLTPMHLHPAAAALVLAALLVVLCAAVVKSRAAEQAAEDRAKRTARGAVLVLCLSVVALVLTDGWTLAPWGWAVLVFAVAALATVRPRARRRLAHRLHVAAAVTMGVPVQRVRLGRLRWRGRDLAGARLRWPATWRVAEENRREKLGDALVWELCGPPPQTPDEHVHRPEYTFAWDPRERALTLTEAPRLPHRLAPQAMWTHPKGVVLGQTDTKSADAVIQHEGREVPVALLPVDRHCLWAGSTQNGKSSAVRWAATSGLSGGHFPAGAVFLDCKGSGSFAGLTGRPGVLAVAHHPHEWRAALGAVLTQVRATYDAMVAWRSGAGPRPHLARGLIVIDEVQMLDGMEEEVGQLARLALESGWVLWVITQRPDARDAVPGAVRDQLEHRISLGPLSGVGARMVHESIDGYERAMTCLPIPGRAVTRIGGRWRTVQVPWCPQPADDAAAERLYPARQGARQPLVAAHPVAATRAPQLGSTGVQLTKSADVLASATVIPRPASGSPRLTEQGAASPTDEHEQESSEPRPVIEPSGLYAPPVRKKRR